MDHADDVMLPKCRLHRSAVEHICLDERDAGGHVVAKPVAQVIEHDHVFADVEQ